MDNGKQSIGVMEVVAFFKIASDEERVLFDRLLTIDHDEIEAWLLVQRVTHMPLSDERFHRK